jgi:putative 4-mercaptohistidine N1-methyltranferase
VTHIYETQKLLSEYLLFHYGEPEQVLPYRFGPRDALGFPIRCVSDCLDLSLLQRPARALEIGCSVGRSSFELARNCESVIGIDHSHRFITAAIELKRTGRLGFDRMDEGVLTTRCVARVPDHIDRRRVHFEVGDALNLREDVGEFDVVLAANVICRLADPAKLIQRLPQLVKKGGQCIITSPYSWTDEFTPTSLWLGGREIEGERMFTTETLQWALQKQFILWRTLDLPFLIREHQRKYQWGVAQAMVWVRK